MNKAKILKFFASESGHKVVFGCTCFVSIAAFTAQYVPNTFCITQLRKILQCYRHGLEREVSTEINQLFDKALNVCDCSEFEKKFLKPFIIVGFDVYQIGSVKSRFSGYIGVPTNYSYKSINDVERAEIQLRTNPIDWSTENGIRLQNALVLTENEKLFGIARSILLLKTHHLLFKSVYAPAALFFTYSTGYYLNRSLNLFTRPLSMRVCLYVLLGIFGAGVYSFLADFTQSYYDIYVDTYLSSSGPDMIKAGVGFYTNILEKNIAIRNMLNNNEYTVNGNVNYFLRQKSLPLTQRKKFFQTKLNEITNKESQSDENIESKATAYA